MTDTAVPLVDLAPVIQLTRAYLALFARADLPAGTGMRPGIGHARRLLRVLHRAIVLAKT